MTPVSLLVIGGYLGAGKTTLIRSLLEQGSDRRLLILVNDFGAIDIDAALISGMGGETISLTNGCVCCVMTGDLFFAVGDALDRDPRPDAIVIEASGVADPARIAAIALAEPELRYGGVVTVVDAERIGELLCDERIGAQVARQVEAADLVAISRSDRTDARPAAASIAALTSAPSVSAPGGRIDAEILFGLDPVRPKSAHAANHGEHFTSWSGETTSELDPDALRDFLERDVEGLFRLKGWIRDAIGTREVHRVGGRIETAACGHRAETRLVAIGPADRFIPDEMERRWQALIAV